MNVRDVLDTVVDMKRYRKVTGYMGRNYRRELREMAVHLETMSSLLMRSAAYLAMTGRWKQWARTRKSDPGETIDLEQLKRAGDPLVTAMAEAVEHLDTVQLLLKDAYANYRPPLAAKGRR